MKFGRRRFVKALAAAAAFASKSAAGRMESGRGSMTASETYDVAVIGAGVFGSWTAHALSARGQKVVLLDAYGASNARASSGGESRVIRAGYGGDELYTRWAARALPLWQEFFRRVAQPLFHNTGVLWLARDQDEYDRKSLATFQKLALPHERLSREDLERRYPQISLGPITWGILEPESGVLMARRAVQAVVSDAVNNGVEYRVAKVRTPEGSARLDAVAAENGERIKAGVFIFACGPWLPKIFPKLLGDRIFPTRQEVYFFGPPAGDVRFRSPAMPTWIDLIGDEAYGMPDIENRGFKVAIDRHGPPFDPDADKRIATPEGIRAVRAYVASRFPALRESPIVETRVCQYENTSNGDFLVDRHPGFENVWLVGGGSGHGFKHGPVMGEYVASRVLGGGPAEPRFALETKGKVQHRAVY